MTVEERLDHIGLDVGHGPEDDGQPSVGHAAASVDASIFPATWKLRSPFASSETATVLLIPSPTYRNAGRVE